MAICLQKTAVPKIISKITFENNLVRTQIQFCMNDISYIIKKQFLETTIQILKSLLH